MDFGKTLGSIALAGVILAEAAWCGPELRESISLLTMQKPHLEYIMEGDTIQGDSVSFEISRDIYTGDLDNILRVVKSDGTSMEYSDSRRNDLEIERLMISPSLESGERMSFHGAYNGTSDEIMLEIQEQFDAYLAKIKQRKLDLALRSVR